MLDDPALNLRHEAAQEPFPLQRLYRFRLSSTFARNFALPERVSAIVTGTYDRPDGVEVAWVTIDLPTGPVYATGVRFDELEPS